MIRAALAISLMTILTACTQAPVREAPARAAGAPSTLPPMKVFATQPPLRPVRSNDDIARDFLDLAFQLESGRTLPRFTRFEQPVSLRITGRPPASMQHDLARLLRRLRSEAGIVIRTVPSGAQANITIQAVPRSEIRRYLPQAACFVVPNVSSLSEYRSARRSDKTDWGLLTKRERLAIFVPADASPQEVRDCLHEELAQALGPLNDLYRLSDSVFNDDNVHTVLTGFDMLILRAYYAPELQSGMSRGEVANRLPAILARINPRGQGTARRPLPTTTRNWVDAVQTALGPGATPSTRRSAASQAVRIANSRGWRDHRRGFSYYAYGRLVQALDAEAAQDAFMTADGIYARQPDSALPRAYVATQLAAYALSSGNAQEALRLTAPHLDTAMRYENAALLSTLMLLRAEALELDGRPAEARAVRLDSLGWARYGFGADWAVRAKQQEISALSPVRRRR